jgi:hypothetical protein
MVLPSFEIETVHLKFCGCHDYNTKTELPTVSNLVSLRDSAARPGPKLLVKANHFQFQQVKVLKRISIVTEVL